MHVDVSKLSQHVNVSNICRLSHTSIAGDGCIDVTMAVAKRAD